jgi:protein-tyrosine-phosphatase
MTNSPAPKRVLFVCIENGNRRQMAEALIELKFSSLRV